METTKRPGYDYNRATLPVGGGEDPSNARSYSGEKEEVNALSVVVFDARRHRERAADRAKGHSGATGIRECVVARFWMGRAASASTVYCSVWITTRDGRHLSGRGSAGGGGYHKESAALEGALISAGVRLEGTIGGCGEGPMRLALLAVARAAGYGRCPMEVL